MTRLKRNLAAALGSMLLLTAVQWIVEAVALLWVFRGQIVPPYDFFTTQVFDFLAKIRFYAAPVLEWAPALPDHFAGPGAVEKLGYAAGLLPPAAVLALILGVLGGVLGAAVDRRGGARLRTYLLVWTVLGVAVHAAASIPPLQLSEVSSFQHVIYRMRSLVVDGTAVSVLVLLLAATLAWALAPLLERTAGARAAAAAVLAVLVGVTSVAAHRPTPEATAAFTPSAPATPPAYNVLLISLDSLRADHVGAYGYARDTTPTLDRLASEGIRFSSAISTSSWTLPTHLTMFTSRYQTAHGVWVDTRVLSPTIPTLAEIMKAAGYSTAGFISGPYVAGHYGYARGMDTYVDLSEGYDHRREAREAIVAPAVNDKALAWLDAHGTERFFLFLHYFDIHYDYVPPAPYDTMFDPDYTGTMDGTNFIERADVNKRMDPRDLQHILALYDGEIRFTDDHLKAIFAKLDRLGVTGKTLVVLVADHGDEFFEHGNKGHHRTVYKEVVDVPFIVRLPDGSHAGTVVDDEVSLVDVMPTILDVAGIQGPPDMEGRNVLDFVDHRGAKRDAVYSEFYDKRGFNVQVARTTPTGKLIDHFNRITHPRSPALEYYRRPADNDEKHDVAATRPPELDRSQEALSAWLDARWKDYRAYHRPGAADSSIKLDDETMERLRSLGYVTE